MIARVADWRARLAAFIAERRAAPGPFGERDCFMTAADAVRAMTDFDFAAEFRGRYATPAGGVRRLRRLGFARVRDVIAASFERGQRFQAGDIVLFAAPPLDVLAIAHDARSCWGVDETGLVRVAIPPDAEPWTVPWDSL